MGRRLIIIMALLLCLFCVKAQTVVKLESDIRPIVRVQINGKVEYMLIDTGSSINILSPQTVYKYKARIRTHYAGIVYSTKGNTNAVHVDSVIIKINEMKINQFVMINISSITENILQVTGIKIAGILGTPAIKELGMVIDLKRGIITLND
jgi:predicted aspartyl protease